MVKQSKTRGPVIEPKQQRSRDTLARILSATRDLLAVTAFEDLAVSQIASRAGCSVGTFYERFVNKDCVLPHLLEIHYEELERELDEALASARLSGATLDERVRVVVRLLVDVARREKGLSRALHLRNIRRPDSVPESIRGSAEQMLGAVYRFLLECRDEIRHSDPQTALSLGLLMMAATIRERIVLAGAVQASTLSIPDERFGAELCGAFVSYLRWPIDPEKE
jgi:AcrR family transcriptional regulator